MSNKKDLGHDECQMEMTPMIDVVFLLLTFFMCTLKFKTLEGKLAAYLPKEAGQDPWRELPIDKVDILVRVSEPGTRYLPGDAGQGRQIYAQGATGRYVWGEDRVLEYSVGTYETTDLEQLRTRLTGIFRERRALGETDVPATIDARPGTAYEDVVEVLDQVIHAGFTHITFVGAYRTARR